MIRLKRTADADLVGHIMTHPAVWRHITDDFSCPPGQFQPNMHPAVIYLVATQDGAMLGMFMFAPENGICYRVHNYLLPAARGALARIAAQEAAAWIWANTNCRRIIGKTPATNRLAVKFAERAGMEVFGIDRNSIQINGKLVDQICSGMSRPQEQF